jgi:hypothetical protein
MAHAGRASRGLRLYLNHRTGALAGCGRRLLLLIAQVCDELLELHRTAALGRELDLHVEELAVGRLRSTERAGTTVRHWTGTTVRHWTGVVSATLPRGVHEHWQKKGGYHEN